MENIIVLNNRDEYDNHSNQFTSCSFLNFLNLYLQEDKLYLFIYPLKERYLVMVRRFKM